MKLTINYRGQLATSEGTDHVTLNVTAGASLRSVILEVVQNDIVVDADGKIRRTLLVAVDGEQVLDLEMPITESTREITLIPPIAGG